MKNQKNKKKKEGEKMIVLKGINKSFFGQVVLKDVDFSFSENENLALVGPNGSGKSTLLKITAEQFKPDKGFVEIDPGLEVSYFPQEIDSEDQKKNGKEFLIQKIGVTSEKLVGEIGLLAKKIRFPLKKLDDLVRNLSGGEKSKLMLISILNSKADFLLLDEPTNNLDLKGLVILENFLEKSKKGFLIVSHDRKFLDKLVSNVVEIDEKKHNIEIYRNLSYSSYLDERKKKREREREQYEGYQEEKKRLLKSARKKKQEASKMASSPKKRRDKDKYAVGFKKDRSKKLASHASILERRTENLEEVKKSKDSLPLNLSFEFSERSGDIVFKLREVEVKYDHFCLGPLDWEVNYGDRIAILGPNGEGKTSLLKIITGNLKGHKGSVQLGSNVKVGYLPQEIKFGLSEDVLAYFLKATHLKQSDARRILARFGFFAEDIKIELKGLSSGERSRLTLAVLMAREVNCLVLDEPTNHLDPEALDCLEEALRNFSGTILLVSHDRYLIDQIGITGTFLMKSGKLSKLIDYHEYEEKVLSEE
jgi:ATPase subunit of ABC transporter with duplicated ATPase domains